MLLLFIFITTLFITLVVNKSDDDSVVEIVVSLLQNMGLEWVIIVLVSVIALPVITVAVQRLVTLINKQDVALNHLQQESNKS